MKPFCFRTSLTHTKTRTHILSPMASGRGSPSKRVDSDPLGDLLENLKQNPIPGSFSSSSTNNYNSVVVLDDWWFVRLNVEGGSKRVAVAGYIAEKEKEFPFTSAPIIKRHDTFTLEAADGVTVKVEGMINLTNTQINGFSHEVCQHFNSGFLFFWEKYIDSCVDSTPTRGASTSQILEQFVNGAREILNCNPEAADPIRINDESLGHSPGTSTKEFEPQHEDGPISTDGKESEEFATPAKGDTVTGTKLPSAGKRKNAVAESKVLAMSVRSGKGSSKKDSVPQSAAKATARGRSYAYMEHEDGLISTEGFATPANGDTMSDAKLLTSEERNNAFAESKVSDMSLRSRKGSSKKDRVPQFTAKATARGRIRADMEQHDNGEIPTDCKDAEESETPEKGDTIRDAKLPTTGTRKNAVAESKQHENGPISTDGKDAEEFATPEKGVSMRVTNLPTTGKRKNAVAESKIVFKGSSKKDHVPQSTSKTIRRGRRHTNIEVHGATISPSQSDSNIRRSRSGRAIIPTIDKGSQTVVYDQNGNFAGIVSSISVSKGGTSKPSKKKRRF